MIEKIVVVALIICFILTIMEKWGVINWIYQKTGFNCGFCYAFWLVAVGCAISIVFTPMEWSKVVMVFCVPPLVNFIMNK